MVNKCRLCYTYCAWVRVGLAGLLIKDNAFYSTTINTVFPSLNHSNIFGSFLDKRTMNQ